MKKEEQTTNNCNCNNECNCDRVLRKVLISLASGVVLGALITTGIFLLVRRTDSPRNHYCNGYLRCPHTIIRDNDYVERFDSELYEKNTTNKSKKGN